MQDAIELETLRRENAHLRELLSIAQEELPRPSDDEQLPLGRDAEAGQGGHAASAGWEDGEAGRKGFESEAMSRTGAGVVVPEEWIKGADQDTVDRLAAEGMIATQV